MGEQQQQCVYVFVCVCVCCEAHLDVSYQELCRCFHWCFGINDFLDGTCPVHGLIEVLGVQPVAVLPPIYCDAPVAWEKHKKKKHYTSHDWHLKFKLHHHLTATSE